MINKKILRIIDANLNRAQEGLRVCEEIIRFIFNDSGITKEFKTIRHRIQAVVKSANITPYLLCSARDTANDIGKSFFKLESKNNWQEIFCANMQRTKEALRVLEEFSKLFNTKVSSSFNKLRFNVYALEKKILEDKKALSHNKCC